MSESTLRYHLKFGVDKYEKVSHRDYEYAIDMIEKYEVALRAIQQWDMLNPPRVEMFSDATWLKQLVDGALLTASDAGAKHE